MKIRNIVLMMLLMVVWGLAPAVPAYAAGNVLDTIHKADEQGSSGNEAPPAVQSPSSTGATSGSGSTTTVTLTPAQIEQMIQAIIKAILQNLGISKTGIVIKLPPAPTPPVVVKPPVPEPPVDDPAEPVTPPATGSIEPDDDDVAKAVAGTAGLRGSIKSKFGISAADGDGAAWNDPQLDRAYKVLSALPSGFRKCTKTIVRDKFYRSSSVLGYVRMGIPTVHLLNSCCKENTFQGTLVHEMAHCFQAANTKINALWASTFWPRGKAGGPKSSSVSSYGNTQPIEDFAESVRVYFQSGSSMKARYPDRYDFIKRYVMSGREY